MRVLGRWIAAMLAGEAVGFAAAMMVGRGVVQLIGGEPQGGIAADLFTIGLASLAGAIEGACLGLAQWSVLRRQIPRLPARAWLLATMAGGAMAWALGMTAGAHGPAQVPAAWVVVLVVLGSGLVLGAVLGAFQGLALRRYTRDAGRWVGASALGWCVGLMFAYAGVALTPGPGLGLFNVVVMVTSGAAMAVAPALATGLVLRDLRVSQPR